MKKREDLRLYVYDSRLFQTAIIDDYISLIWTDRYGDCGEFELHVNYSSDMKKMLQLNTFCRTNYSERWAVIEKIEIKTEIDEPSEMIVTGRSLECILERRIVLDSTEFGGDNEKVSVQESVKQLLDEAFIEPENTDRLVENFIFQASTDPAVTSLEFEDSFDGEDLLSVISGICENHKIGFKITIDDDFRFVFNLYKGKDRSYEQSVNDYVVFAPHYDNLLNSSFYTASDEYRNLMYVNKTSSEYVEVSLYPEIFPSGINRYETQINSEELQKNSKKSLSDSKITVKARNKLKEDFSYKTAFEGEIVPENIFVYGVDYFVGDIVQFCDKYGNKKPLRVKEFVISNDADGFQMIPGFEDPSEEEDDD